MSDYADTLMFVDCALLYPCVLAALCAGAGLLVDRCSGGVLPGALLLTVGGAALIALSQLTTYVYFIAPATPYLMVAVALAGFVLARERVRELARRCREQAWPVATVLIAFLIALAPVLIAGRATFSSFMALSDSAVHMFGADFLIRHGQHYAHLDLRNSYGQFINNYYDTSYPSGADTLYGGSSLLLGLPLIWTFQPFNAFMLAIGAGPAWVIARRMGLDGLWAALAALSAVVPALVYAYELFGSVKEITALSMILSLGALVVLHRRWLSGSPVRVVPFALVLAGGISALGVAFGVWSLVACAVLACVLVGQLRAERRDARGTLGLLAVAAGAVVIAAWPTWIDLPGSIRVAQNIASTSNPGNLHSPLRGVQVLGVWLGGSYKLDPTGTALTWTHALIALALVCALVGAIHVIRVRAYSLAGWLGLSLLAWVVITESVTTWGEAKAIMLTSPAVVLLAWGGVAALKSVPRARLSLTAAGLLAFALAGGVLASDFMQYRASDLAPTARYDELASLDSRFAGHGPTLFTDFDEYSMYELRDLDVGGPDFVYPPARVAAAAGGYGEPVALDRVSPSALLGYPLIMTRRDPAASRPPAAYTLQWQGRYYQVWSRRPGAPAALAHVTLAGSYSAQCARIGQLARGAPPDTDLTAAESPELIRISLAHASHPADWGHAREGLAMSRPGTLSAKFSIPVAGRWEVWVQGQLMPTVELGLDGNRLASIGGQLSGNSLVPNTTPPIVVELSAGVHSLSVRRSRSGLAPGDDGAAVLDAVFLTPPGADGGDTLRTAAATRWRGLCGRGYEWVELVPASIGSRT